MNVLCAKSTLETVWMGYHASLNSHVSKHQKAGQYDFDTMTVKTTDFIDATEGPTRGFSKLMIGSCAKIGMKPVCDNYKSCGKDTNALYIGNRGNLGDRADRENPSMMPTGALDGSLQYNDGKISTAASEAFSRAFSGVCTYTGHKNGRANCDLDPKKSRGSSENMQDRGSWSKPFVCGKFTPDYRIQAGSEASGFKGCLSTTGKKGPSIRISRCDSLDTKNQQWAFLEHSGQIKSKMENTNVCLVGDKTGQVWMAKCDVDAKEQQWKIVGSQLQLKGKKQCLDSSVSIKTCDTKAKSQRFIVRDQKRDMVIERGTRTNVTSAVYYDRTGYNEEKTSLGEDRVEPLLNSDESFTFNQGPGYDVTTVVDLGAHDVRMLDEAAASAKLLSAY